MKTLPLLLLLFPLTTVAACGVLPARRTPLAIHTDTFGITLLSTSDYREIGGVQGEDEPCIHGFERDFDAAGVRIGYGFDGRIRKIVTRNPATSIAGVRPGTPYAEGREAVLGSGFAATPSRYVFMIPGGTLTLLVEDDRVFGVMIEAP